MKRAQVPTSYAEEGTVKVNHRALRGISQYSLFGELRVSISPEPGLHPFPSDTWLQILGTYFYER
jgi:hypothetical protein